MNRDLDCSLHTNRLHCCHSSEAILLLLSSTPLRLSIKEMQELTGFHRNTLRPALRNLKKEGKIKSFGDFKSQQYFYEDINEIYRGHADAFNNLAINEEIKLQLAHDFALNLVKRRLQSALENGPEFIHESLYEALVHVKMAYPFSDIYLDSDGKAKSSTIFHVQPKKHEYIINPTDFNLRIHACLCNGVIKTKIPCQMVAGALKGAIKGAIGVDAEVIWTQSGYDEEKGAYCEYNICGEQEFSNLVEEQLEVVVTQDEWHKTFHRL